MHTPNGNHHHRRSPAEYAALMDEAKQRAVQARREAQQAFWTAVLDKLRNAWSLWSHWRQAAQGRRTTHSWEA